MKRPVLSLSIRHYVALMMGTATLVPHFAHADDAAADKDIAEVQVTADRLHVLPTEAVESVFGFGKTALETPRAITSISAEMLDKVIITEIDDLVALTPGSFTQSFFGVAGSLDVRGTPGENYFRGVKRIDNPGNYPTPIGASDRIDVVRGPASPIYGPSKIGGYLNFVPKSARASTGQFFDEPKSEVGMTVGSWEKRVITGEVGGPATLFGKNLGYYLYAEAENSGSYYDNTETDQNIYQVSFDMNITDTLRTEFGGMYHNYKGNQVAGWNRVTQELIDHGTYITGEPVSLDTNGNGRLDQNESAAGNIGAFIFAPSTQSSAQIQSTLAAHPNMQLQNSGTTHIKGSTVLVQEDDTLEDDVITLYGDLIWELPSGLKITDKNFYEKLENLNENVYGFSQFANTWAYENQLIFGYELGKDGPAKVGLQASPSVRYQNFEHGDDFDYEYFDRRDITQSGSPVDRRALATRGEGLYSDHVTGSYTDIGLSFMADVTLWQHLNILGGARFDSIDMNATSHEDAVTNPGLHASDTKDATSWSGSISYALPFGLRPYVTKARQSTLIIGQGGQIDPSNIESGTAVADSKLDEYGVKASLLDNQLYLALDYFKQSRMDFSAQDTVTNNTTEAKGYEFEARWVVNPVVTLTGAYTDLTVTNLTALKNGTQFSFAGAGDLKGVDPASFLGGVVSSLVLVPNEQAARKAGIPKNMYSAYALLSLPGALKGFTASIGATHVDAVWSGFSKTVKLPAYTLVNAGVHYESRNWQVGIQGKNLTNERYFRSNFPDLFGSSVVLPELPRNYLVSASYKF